MARSLNPPLPKVHGFFGSSGAFFKDSIRRDAIIGVKIVFALWESKSPRGQSGIKIKMNLHPGREHYPGLKIRIW